MAPTLRKQYLLGLLLALTPLTPLAQQVSVAVASNFIAPMQEIAAAFERQSGHRTVVSSGSSGKLYAQIRNGAPFQVFLSADRDKPAALERVRLAMANTRFTYALGTLVLLTSSSQADPEAMLQNGHYRKLALANPRLAPYGAAAMEALSALNLTDQAMPRLVLGENIAQAFQFISSGNAQLGFVARSQIARDKSFDGRYWLVPAALYRPIRQDAVLLKRGADNPAARALLEFLRDETAIAIMRDFGYGQPGEE